MPAAPKAGTVQAPKAPLPAPSQPTAERLQLEALMKSLGSMKESLPPEAVEAIEQLQLTTTQDTTKELHRMVAAQSTAKKQLIQVRAARAAYVAAWNEYIVQVSDLIQTQVQQQTEQLEHYDATEAAWAASLDKARRSSLAEPPSPLPVPSRTRRQEMDIAETQVDNDIEVTKELESRRQQHLADSARLMEAMEVLKTTAAQRLSQESAEHREGSRTPRRQKIQCSRPDQGGADRHKATWSRRRTWQAAIAAAAATQGAPWWGQCVSFRGPHWPIESGMPFLQVYRETSFMPAHLAALQAYNLAVEVRIQCLPGLLQHTFLGRRTPGG